MENTNEETRISISDACVTDCTANFTVAGISDKVNSLSENMLEPIQSTEVDSDSFFKIPAVSLKVVSDIQKDLSIPKNASLGALLRFFRTMRPKKTDVRAKKAYQKTCDLISKALDTNASLTEYHFHNKKLTMWLKFTDFKNARIFVEFVRKNS